MDHVDLLIVNALQVEADAAEAALRAVGVALQTSKIDLGAPYLIGKIATTGGECSIGLARPTRMGAVPVATVASSLVGQLKPICLAMSGVCAGNPDSVALGDVIVAEIAYAYDEGKRTNSGFEGDHRQIPLTDNLHRLAQELSVQGLSTFGVATEDERRAWLLEQLAAGLSPTRHPARDRYLGGALWGEIVRRLEREELIQRVGSEFELTPLGIEAVEARRAYSRSPIERLPFAVHVGPVASGNAVVKDGVTWGSLKAWGVRTVLGLEMEAAAIAQVAYRLDVPYWLVVKGVMDYADPKKDDRFKPFAALASAQVLVRLLQTSSFKQIAASSKVLGTAANVIGDIKGSHIGINQSFTVSKY